MEKEKREYVEKKIGKTMLTGCDDDCYEFMYRAMHEYGMDFNDAERWAWLNTLFGYDIGADNARVIINWLYLNGQDVLEVEAKQKGTVKAICEDELGLHVNFSKWTDRTPSVVEYSFDA